MEASLWNVICCNLPHMLLQGWKRSSWETEEQEWQDLSRRSQEQDQFPVKFANPALFSNQRNSISLIQAKEINTKPQYWGGCGEMDTSYSTGRKVQWHSHSVHTKTCTQMFIAALLTTSQNRNQLKCLSVSEWLKKLWYSKAIKYQLLCNKKGQVTDTQNNLDGSQGSYAVWKKKSGKVIPVWLHYTTFLKWQNYIEMVNIDSCSG